MQISIKNRKDFKTKLIDSTDSWSIPISSALDDTGSAVVTKTEERLLNQWAYLDGNVFVISAESPDEGTNTLTLSPPATIFSRSIFWPDNPTMTYGQFIKDAIEREYIQCSDEAYRIPYLYVENSDFTGFEQPKLDETGLYSLDDIILEAQERGVVIRYTIVGDRLRIGITTKTETTHNVFFDDGRSEIDSETYSDDAVAKVTVMQKHSSNNEDGSQDISYSLYDFYLSETGNISNTVPDQRASGKWVYTTIEEDDDPIAAAESVIAENVASHKIEFYSENRYDLWDTVNLKLAGQVFSTSIVAITTSSSDNRYKYRCGELKVKLSEKIASTKSESKTV